jgi:phenol 2-monooxygenase
VAHQASASPLHLAERLVSNGYWRVLVFSGDLREDKNRRRLDSFAETFKPRLETMRIPIEILLIHSSSRIDVSILDLPDIFHPFDEALGWDYSRVFADMDAYEGYGVEDGCVVVCRPDQHVGWIGSDVADLKAYFSFVK